MNVEEAGKESGAASMKRLDEKAGPVARVGTHRLD